MISLRALRRSSLFLLSFCILPSSSSAAAPDQGKAVKKPTASDIEKTLSAPNAGYESHMTAAQFFQSQGLISQAMQQLHIAVDFKEAKPEAFKNLAQLCLQSQDKKQAEEVIMAGVKRFPSDYGVLLTAGYVFHNEHKLQDALDMYRKASGIRPSVPDIWLAIGDVLIDMKQPEEALRAIDKALVMPNPSSLAYFEDAKALLALGRLNDALLPFRKNFEKNPFNYTSSLAYSALLQKLNKFEEALDVRLCLVPATSGKNMDDLKLMVSDLISKLPPDTVQRSTQKAEDKIGNPRAQAVLHFALGDIYDKMHRADEGMLQYKKGLALNPKFARGYLRLGEDLEDSKSDFSQALTNYEKASSLNPNDPEIKSRLDKLKTRIKTKK